MAKKNWPGTESDTYSNTSDMKPVSPPCDSNQFAEVVYDFDAPDGYDTPRFDAYNQVTVNSDYHSENATAGTGQWGNRQFASNRSDIQSTGYGSNMGLNEIPYGTGAGFNRAETIYVAVDRADRGRDS